MKLARAIDGRQVLRSARGLQVKLDNLRAALILSAILVAIVIVSLGIGVFDTGVAQFTRWLFGGDTSATDLFALGTVRLPRILLGFLAGWCVALSGAILQSISRNPLADPGLFGLSQGSMTTIMLLLVFIPAAPKWAVAMAAIGGALAVALLLIWLVGGARRSGLALLLMGIAVETVLSSIGSLLLLYTPTETSMMLGEWMAGSLFLANWSLVATFIPLLLLSLIGIIVLGRSLSAYDLGNEMAMALGEPVGRSRPLILLFAVIMSASSVATVGPLTFLGVLAPQLAGFLSPAVGRARLLLSAFTGGILVVSADALARGLAADLPLPIGLSLTLIGVPLFILALRLRSLRRLQIP